MNVPVKVPEETPRQVSLDVKELASALTGGLVAATVLGLALEPAAIMVGAAGIGYAVIKALASWSATTS